MIILLLASLLPPIYLLKEIYALDRIEPEPPRMILKLFFFGVLSTIPAGIIESVLIENVLHSTGIPLNSPLYNFITYFLIVAITEEGVKHFALRKGTWNSPEFNYRFDAVVYSVAVTLGFAALENISYVFSYGLHVALMRAITSIPGHCIFGIYMGYYYGQARYFALRKSTFLTGFYNFMSMFIPVILHGFYDYCASSKKPIYSIIFFGYIVIMDIIAIKQVHKFSDKDDLM